MGLSDFIYRVSKYTNIVLINLESYNCGAIFRSGWFSGWGGA